MFVLIFLVVFAFSEIPDQASGDLVWKFPKDICRDNKQCPNFYYGTTDGDIGITMAYFRVSEINSTGNVAGGNREIDRLPSDFVIKSAKASSNVNEETSVFFNGTLKGICPTKMTECAGTIFESDNYFVNKGEKTVNGQVIKKGQIKLTFIIRNWPYENGTGTTNKLRLTWKFTGKNLRKPVTVSLENRKLTIKEERAEVIIDFDGPCKVDGVSRKPELSMEDKIESDKFVLVHATFAHGNVIDYDPTFEMIPGSTTSNGVILSLSLIAIIFSFLF